MVRVKDDGGESYRMGISYRLRAILKAKDIDGYKGLARVCGLKGASATSNSNNWLNGVNPPPVPKAILLAEHAGVTLDYIYRGITKGMDANLAAKLEASLESVFIEMGHHKG